MLRWHHGITELPAEWNTAVIRDHNVAAPALLCHKESAQGTQSPLVAALGRNTKDMGGMSCLSLVPYGIRSPIIDPVPA